MQSCVRFTRFGEPALAALADAINDAKVGDLLRPVTVVTPSGAGAYAGLHARRRLTFSLMGANQKSGGLTNVRFMPLPRVAELLGEAQLTKAGKHKLTDPLRREIARVALASSSSFIARHTDNPNVMSSLLHAFEMLSAMGEVEISRICTSPVTAARETALLFGSYIAELSKRGFYDESAAIAAATMAVKADEPDADIGHIVFYLPRSTSAAELNLLVALMSRRRVTAIIGLTGIADADREAIELANALGENEIPNIAPPTYRGRASVEIVTDAEEEARAAISTIRESLTKQHTPLWRIAILYRQENPYARICAERLKAAELECFVRTSRTLAQTLPGRMILGLLRAYSENFTGPSVVEWLRSAPLRAKNVDEDIGKPLQLNVFETALRRSGAIRGLQAWINALGASIRGREQDLRRRNSDLDPQASEERFQSERGTDSRLRQLADAERFLNSIQEWPLPPEAGKWQERAKSAADLLEYLRFHHTAGSDWSLDDAEAYDLLKQAIERLGVLDVVGRNATQQAFLSEVEFALFVRVKQADSRYAAGVFVGSFADAWGLEFDQVFIMGTHDGSFPPLVRPDPLLPDRALAPNEMRSRNGELRDYLAAGEAAQRLTYLYSRSDRRAGRSNQPSRWLLNAARELHGSMVTSADLESLAQIDAPWLTRWNSFNHAVRERKPGSMQEFNLRILASDDALQSDILTAARELIEARSSSALTTYDGFVGHGLYEPGVGPFSASRLETFAQCPYKYFLRNVLELEEPDREEEPYKLGALEKGNLLHEILRSFFEDRIPRGMPAPDETWTESDKADLERTATEILGEFEASGKVAVTPIWEAEKRWFDRILEIFPGKDSAMRKGLGVTPQRFESSFDGDEATLELEDGSTVTFRGKIDRIDIGADGRAEIIDYKTGSITKFNAIKPENPVDGGKCLQLGIYALVTDAQARGTSTARYWFITSDKKVDFRRIVWDGATKGELIRVVSLILEGMRSGAFPAVPGTRALGSFENCKNCGFDRICSADRDLEWEAKHADPRVAFLDEMRGKAEGDDDVADSGVSE